MPNELQKIDFHGDAIFAYQDDETKKIYVSVRAICESLGISFQGQHKKLTSDPVYEDALRYQLMLTARGKQKVLLLDSETLHGLLFSIQTNRLKPEAREMHILFKRECLKVLNDYFTKGIAVAPGVELMITDLTERVDKLEQKLSGPKVPSSNQQKQNLRHEQVRSGILEAVSTSEKTTDQLYAHFNRNISARVLHAVVSALIQENLIVALLQATRGRSATLYQKPT